MEQKSVLLLAYGFTGDDALNSLLENPYFNICGVVTPPFKTGRYRTTLIDLPVEITAQNSRIDVHRTNSEEDIANIISSKHIDSVLVCAYNKILSPSILSGVSSFYNVHHGDLPRWRGNSGSEWAVILGRNEIGVTLHELVEGLDSGNIFWQQNVTISDDEDITHMRKKIKDVIRYNLGGIFYKILEGSIESKPQNGEVSYTCPISGEDGVIDWNKSCREIRNLIRGLCDPELDNAFTFYLGKKLGVLSAKYMPDARKFEGRIPGKPVRIYSDGDVEILTGDGSLLIRDILYDGKKCKAADVIRSTRLSLGSISDYVKYLERKIINLENRVD